MAIGQYGPEYFQFDDGGPAAEVRIFIFLPGTKTKAILYSDRNGLYTAPNPMWTDRRGEIVFFAEAGNYDLYYEEENTTIAITIGGESSSADVYVHPQTAPSTSWVIPHFLGIKPSVTVEESTGIPDDVTIPAIRHLDLNHTELRWGYPATGLATLRR